MPGAVETVKLQVELFEKNAEARLRALDKLAREMGNRKITLNFDEASLERWKQATAGMTDAQVNAYAKIVSAVEKTTQAQITAANKVQTEVVKAEAAKAVATENAEAKKKAAIEKTAQVERAAVAKEVAAKEAAEAKKVAAKEKTSAAEIAAEAKTTAAEIAANAKETAAKEAAEAKKVAAIEKTKRAQERTKTLVDSLTQSFSKEAIALSLIYSVISRIKQAVSEAVNDLKEMDKELTTIQIVTGMSDWDKWNMSQDAYAGAKAQGRTVTDYLSASERFARAGYRENIKDLTELSLVTQNIGGVTEETASKFLLAADAAWQMGGSTERLWAMLDGVSSIADQNATDIGKIAEAYTVAGSAFANAGESEASFAALIGTTTAATQRSGSEMARGLQTILFRVRQVKGELDDGEIINAEDISNAAEALDSVGISVLNDKNQLKGFTEIMGELNEKWDQLNSTQKAYIQDKLAGNRRGNILFTLMDHWQDYERMLEQFEEGAGTAAQKNAIYTESWAAATANLKTSWAELIGNLTENGGLFTELIEGLTGIFDILNAILEPLAEIKAFLSQYGFHWLSGPIPEWIGQGAKSIGITGTKGKRLSIVDSIRSAIERNRGTEGFSGGGGGHRFDSDFVPTIQSDTNAIEEYTVATTESADAIKTWQEYLADAVKEGKIELKLVNQITDAFNESSEAIKSASKAISEEKDKDVKDIGDIYKAMKEAAESGYYGSNAMQRGFEIFYSDRNLNYAKQKSKVWFSNLAQYGVEEYFTTIEDGDYGKAAFDLLWGRATKGKKGEGFFSLVSQAGKELIKAVETDSGYEFEFNNAGQSMADFLSDLSDATGFSKTFLSSVIQSIGMYDSSLEQWEQNADKYDIEIKTNDGEVIEGIDKIADAIANLPDTKEIDIILNTIETTTVKSSSFTPSSASTSAANYAQEKGQSMTDYYRKRGYAGGKHDSYSGIALVNDEFPADGSKPELIISKSQGRAYIANGGKPALVNLGAQDVVLSADETRKSLSSGGVSFPRFAAGKNSFTIIDPWGNVNYEYEGTSTASAGSVKINTPKPNPKPNPNPNPNPNPPEAAKPNPSESWGTLKKLVDYLLEKGEKDLKEQLKVLDDQLDELEAERKAQEESNKLQEKQEGVQNALLDLQKAQTERTVRYYNEETQQWEWMADQGSVQKAQEAYDEALKDLNEYLAGQDYEARKAEIQARKEELQAQFDQYKESWDSIIDAIEAPAGDVKAILDEIRKNGTSTMKAQSGGIAELLNQLRDGLVSIGYAFGLGNINANTDSSSTTAETVFDSGGFAFGGGLMRKGNIGAETVIGPDITNSILNPVRNSRFSAFADSIRNLMSASNTIAAGSSYITNNSGGNIFVNGIKIGSDMMQQPFVEVMRTISLHVNEAI